MTRAWLLLVLLGCELDAEQLGAVKQNAMAWAGEMGFRPVGVSCSNVDSDQDGYVSCTINVGDGVMQAIECRAWRGEGCKLRPDVKVIRR